MRTLVIDPGHGGHTPLEGSTPLGVCGPRGTREKDVALSLARRLRERLRPNVRVLLTRDADENCSLAERAEVARRGAHAFLSLHANGGEAGVRGSETWVHRHAPRGLRSFAAAVQRSLAGPAGSRRGVLAGDLALLHPARLGHTDACLVEIDYLSDAGGEARLRDARALDGIAEALAGAVEHHLGVARLGRAQVRPLGDNVADTNEALIAGYEQTLGDGFIPRLMLSSVKLDQSAYDAAGRSTDFGDHFYRLVEVERRCLDWIGDLEQTAIAQIRDDATRQKFLDMDWTANDFTSKNAKALFAEMAKRVPERRAILHITYHNVEQVVQTVPDDTAYQLHPEAKDAFVDMRTAAHDDSVSLAIGSAFRTEAQQNEIARKNHDGNAVAQGRSVHNYGLAVDLLLGVAGLQVAEISTRPMTNLIAMYRSPVYKWMYVNAERCGWVPYSQEPWHWEYNPPGFKERFESRKLGRPTARALDENRYQFEQSDQVRRNIADSLTRAETSDNPSYYGKTWWRDERWNFGIASWTGSTIADVLDVYVEVAGEQDATDRLYGLFGDQATFQSIRDRFRSQGAAAQLSAAERGSFTAMGNDVALREAQRRKRAQDIQVDLDAVGNDGGYPWIDGYMDAISEIAAHVLVHARHQHGRTGDLVQWATDQLGGNDELGKKMVDGSVTEQQFLQKIADRVVALVPADAKDGVKRRYKDLFDTYGSSSLAYYFHPREANAPIAQSYGRYGKPARPNELENTGLPTWGLITDNVAQSSGWATAMRRDTTSGDYTDWRTEDGSFDLKYPDQGVDAVVKWTWMHGGVHDDGRGKYVGTVSMWAEIRSLDDDDKQPLVNARVDRVTLRWDSDKRCSTMKLDLTIEIKTAAKTRKFTRKVTLEGDGESSIDFSDLAGQ